MRHAFFMICKLFGKKDRLAWAESAAAIFTLLLVVISHSLFLAVIFTLDVSFIVERYGGTLMVISLFLFSCLYFFLSSKFKGYAKAKP
jgi:hypothetical protein